MCLGKSLRRFLFVFIAFPTVVSTATIAKAKTAAVYNTV